MLSEVSPYIIATVGILGTIVGVILAYVLNRSGKRDDVSERRSLDFVRVETILNVTSHNVQELQRDVKDLATHGATKDEVRELTTKMDLLASTVAGVQALLSAFVKVEPKR